MALPKKYDFNDYDNYLTDPNPTTSAEAQDYFRNMDMLVSALVDAYLWQPNTTYAKGDVVKSNAMPSNVEAVCVNDTNGKSSNIEPSWGSVGGGNVSDGTCFWRLRMQGTVTSVNGVKPNVNGEVEVTIPVMQSASASSAGKAGLVPAPAKGDENKSLCGDGTFKDLSGIGGVLPIANGGTGATTAENARKNLVVNQKSYNTYEQLGFSSVPTLTRLLEALPNYSEFVRYISSSEASTLGVPDGGILTITKGQYVDYASIYHNRYGGDDTVRKAWYESWQKGQVSFNWKELVSKSNMLTPDYENGYIRLERNVKNTIAKNGFVYIRHHYSSDGNSALRVYINNKELPSVQSNNYSYDSLFYPVQKGDTVECTATTGESYIAFFGARW